MHYKGTFKLYKTHRKRRVIGDKKIKYVNQLKFQNEQYCTTTITKSSIIGVLRNGSITKFKSIRLDNEYMSFVNTCTFDSISQVIFCAYADSENYGQFVENNIQNTFMELVSYALHDGINVQSYRKRTLFLKDLFTKEAYQYLNKITVINSACTAQYMVNKIFETFLSISEEK